MNGKPTFAFTMSRVQAMLAIAMDMCNLKAFLNLLHRFVDDTFKRCTGFVTLLSFAYVGPLRKMVELYTMEAETEGTENCTIFGSS